MFIVNSNSLEQIPCWI